MISHFVIIKVDNKTNDPSWCAKPNGIGTRSLNIIIPRRYWPITITVTIDDNTNIALSFDLNK